MEREVVIQRATVQLLLLLHFMSLPNKRLEGLGNTKICGFRCCVNFLVADDKMLLSYKLYLYFAFATAFSNTNVFFIT